MKLYSVVNAALLLLTFNAFAQNNVSNGNGPGNNSVWSEGQTLNDNSTRSVRSDKGLFLVNYVTKKVSLNGRRCQIDSYKSYPGLVTMVDITYLCQTEQGQEIAVYLISNTALGEVRGSFSIETDTGYTNLDRN